MRDSRSIPPPRSTGPAVEGSSSSPTSLVAAYPAARCCQGPSSARCRRRASRSYGCRRMPPQKRCGRHSPPRRRLGPRCRQRCWCSHSPGGRCPPLPQQRTDPSSSVAQVWDAPAEISFALRPNDTGRPFPESRCRQSFRVDVTSWPLLQGPSSARCRCRATRRCGCRQPQIGSGARASKVHGADRSGSLVVADVLGIAVPQLAFGTPPPAAHGAVVEDGAGVIAACRDGDGGASGPEVDGCHGARRLVVADVLSVPIAQLAFGTFTPTANGAVVEKRTAMAFSATRLSLLGVSAQVDGSRETRVLVVADRCGAGVAQLPAAPKPQQRTMPVSKSAELVLHRPLLPARHVRFHSRPFPLRPGSRCRRSLPYCRNRVPLRHSNPSRSVSRCRVERTCGNSRRISSPLCGRRQCRTASTEPGVSLSPM